MLFMLYLLTVFGISYDDILIFGISTLYIVLSFCIEYLLLALLYNTMADKTKIEIKPYLTFQSKFVSGQQKENMQCYDLALIDYTEAYKINAKLAKTNIANEIMLNEYSQQIGKFIEHKAKTMKLFSEAKKQNTKSENDSIECSVLNMESTNERSNNEVNRTDEDLMNELDELYKLCEKNKTELEKGNKEYNSYKSTSIQILDNKSFLIIGKDKSNKNDNAIELSEQGSLFMNSLETDFEKIKKKILDLQKIYKEGTILESKKDHKEKSFKYIKEKYTQLLKYYKYAIDTGKLCKQKDI